MERFYLAGFIKHLLLSSRFWQNICKSEASVTKDNSKIPNVLSSSLHLCPEDIKTYVINFGIPLPFIRHLLPRHWKKSSWRHTVVICLSLSLSSCTFLLKKIFIEPHRGLIAAGSNQKQEDYIACLHVSLFFCACLMKTCVLSLNS